MRLAACRRAVTVRMPAAELGSLCFLPEMQQLMALFPKQIKVNLLSPPHFLALTRQVVPLVLATPGDAPALHKLRRTLRTVLNKRPQAQENGP